MDRTGEWLRFSSGDFGSTTIGTPATLDTTVTNLGSLDATPSAITATGTGVAVTGGTCAVATVIRAGGTCDVQLSWSPTSTGALSGASLTMAYPGGSKASDTQPLSGIVQIDPVLYWRHPKMISYGTPLGERQLDAGANVDGHFYYFEPAGTIIPGGVQTLHAVFVPDDSTTYSYQFVTTTIRVKKSSSTTSLSMSTASVTFGAEGSTTFHVTVSGPNGSPGVGTVIVRAGKKKVCTIILDSSGAGACSPANSALKPGSYPVVATLSKSTSLKPSSSTGQSLTVGG